ncbi:ATP-binding protein [Luteibacter aegosomatis]|uniref:hybrid sensor histidine kinase/response regulator n=1 Tax=Luteibacter aegosomatis TaxID=2911537 RepID=UPI001FF8BDA0|nr:ATP-binding protein [Luteibacter aegosomatis]UPG87636.1 ATP-binding protein [Luteibacter aegosomatis]
MLTKIHRMKGFVDWLQRAPIADKVERRYAPALQGLMAFILVTIPGNWAYHLAVVRTPLRRDMAVDIGADVVVWAGAGLALWLIRRGRLRRAVQSFVAAMLLALTAMYVSVGLTRQLLDQTYPVLTIVLGGLVLGRRQLWTIYGLLLAMFCGGAVTDVLMLTARAYARPWIGAANLPSLAMSYFAITFIVDRCVKALHDEMLARELAQEELLHAQKMETVGRLASGVAHDFNNVLAVIAGYADQVRDSADARRLRDAVGGMALAARRGAAVSRKLLTFSRRETPRPEVIDVGAAVAEAVPMLRQLFTSPQSVILHDVLPQPAHVRIDRAQFELSLLNIAANARDAMDAAGVFTVTVRPWTHSAVAGVTVELSDDGTGIPEEVASRVFEPYFTTKPAGAGTGLGLAVVREVMAAGGGQAAVVSRPGMGTTVRLWLPMVAAPMPALATPAHRALRVLLIEDEIELRHLLLDAFDDAGHVAMGASTVDEAVDALAQVNDEWDLVISDGHLPGNVDGRLAWLETAAPIVLISATAEPEAHRLRALGRSVHCLPKPFAPAALVAMAPSLAQRVRAA